MKFKNPHEVEVGARVARQWEDWWEGQLDATAANLGELVIKVGVSDTAMPAPIPQSSLLRAGEAGRASLPPPP